jgi:hypothetical protein
VRTVGFGYFFGCAFGDDLAAAYSPFGSHVDHVIGAFEHVEVVLDDDDSVAAIDEFLENFNKRATSS